MIDDDPAGFQLQPQNAIHITPYLDANDRDDTQLLDLIPFLSALVNEEVSDFPSTLSSFSSREAKVGRGGRPGRGAPPAAPD